MRYVMRIPLLFTMVKALVNYKIIFNLGNKNNNKL